MGPNSQDFYHGHYKNKKGVVSYNGYEFSKGFPTNSHVNSWVVACAKNTNSTNPSENVIINGVSCGLFIEPEYTEQVIKPISTLTINYDGSYAYNSEWAFSYLLIWDSHLSDIELKNVSIALNSFLENGETLSFMNSQSQISYSSDNAQLSTSDAILRKAKYSGWDLTMIQKQFLGIL
jgi:hypothetical protein